MKVGQGRLPPGPKLRLDRILFNRGGPGEQLKILPSAARDYGPVVGFRFRKRIALVLLDDPAHIRYVLRTNNRNYLKSDQYELVKQVVGEGLIASEGDFWRRQRRLVQPAFHRRRRSRVKDVTRGCPRCRDRCRAGGWGLARYR